MSCLIEADATMHPTAADLTHRVLTLARCEGDLSGREADTLAGLLGAALAAGAVNLTITIDDSTDAEGVVL